MRAVHPFHFTANQNQQVPGKFSFSSSVNAILTYNTKSQYLLLKPFPHFLINERISNNINDIPLCNSG